MYKLTNNNSIIRLSDNACIPPDEHNRDYAAYLAWLDEGNAPQPADSPSAERLATDARAKRDRLLSATDWTQIPDAPLTTEQSAAYAAYRQALRDVPQQAGFPAVIEWPVGP